MDRISFCRPFNIYKDDESGAALDKTAFQTGIVFGFYAVRYLFTNGGRRETGKEPD